MILELPNNEELEIKKEENYCSFLVMYKGFRFPFHTFTEAHAISLGLAIQWALTIASNGDTKHLGLIRSNSQIDSVDL